MCCCDKPNVNGELGYKWQPNDNLSIRRPDPPTITDCDTLLYDEPGRCGGVDSHCHHYRLIGGACTWLLYKHGGGEGRIRLSNSLALRPILAALDSNARYWIFNAIYHAHNDGQMNGAGRMDEQWRKAAAEKRIKTRKLPHNRGVKVWREPELLLAEGRD